MIKMSFRESVSHNSRFILFRLLYWYVAYPLVITLHIHVNIVRRNIVMKVQYYNVTVRVCAIYECNT